jgi:hypothetical protein
MPARCCTAFQGTFVAGKFAMRQQFLYNLTSCGMWRFNNTFHSELQTNCVCPFLNVYLSVLMLKHRQNGRKRLGELLKRLLDGAETGLLGPNWCRMMMMMMIILMTFLSVVCVSPQDVVTLH